MKIQETFTPALQNKSSAKYQSLKSNVESGLETSIKKTQPGVEKVTVTGFRAGSVIADYDIIITDAEAAENISADTMQSAINSAITTATFTGIAVNTTYLPTVQGKSSIVYQCYQLIHILLGIFSCAHLSYTDVMRVDVKTRLKSDIIFCM